MSTDKRIDRICVIVLVLTLLLTTVFMNGSLFGIQAVADEDAEYYEGTAHFTANDLNGSWDTSNAVRITLEGTDGNISGNGAYFLDGNLVIVNGGYYVIEGELTDGSIIVDAYQSSKVWILLNGVSISCSDDAGIRIDQADKVFLTLAGGTENSVVSGETFSDEALEGGSNAAIFSHDDLTINGDGSLTVTAEYKHGIVSKDDLIITGGQIRIEAVQDGIHVNESFAFTGADLEINVSDDGIHSDTSIYIEDGSIRIPSCYEGLEAVNIEIAGGTIEIEPKDDGINANGGSNSFMMGGGMGQMRGGFNRQMNAQGTPAVLSESSVDSQAAQDAAGSQAVQDTADSADSQATQGAADSQTAQTEEGSGTSAPAQVSDSFPGTMQPRSEEANAETKPETKTEAEAEAETETATVLISGGDIRIVNTEGNDADGIDSNGDIHITGGTVFVSMNGNGGNNALDYGSENGGSLIIDGGVVAAFGGSSMLEEVSEESGQCTFTYVSESLISAGSTVSLQDAKGNTLIEYEVPGSISAVTISCPELEKGQTYQLLLGEDTQEEISLESTVSTIGTASGMMGGIMKGNGGGMGHKGGRGWNRNAQAAAAPETSAAASPENAGSSGETSQISEEESSQMSDGEMPQMPDGQMPQMPDGQMPQMSQMPDGETPQMPDGEMPQMPDGQMPQRPDGEMPQMTGAAMPDQNQESGEMASAETGSSFRHSGMQPGQGDFMQEEDGSAVVDTRLSLSEIDSQTWLWLAFSAAALVLAGFAAKHYRRRTF